ncbi:MAG: hypothetical protein PHU14_10645 [Methylovulum sp.]|nr:hypothetical protein [Methylovulum sp.]
MSGSHGAVLEVMQRLYFSRLSAKGWGNFGVFYGQEDGWPSLDIDRKSAAISETPMHNQGEN